MTPEDRAHKYIVEMNIQRKKMFNAYAKYLSYCSKLENDPVLANSITVEDQEKLQWVDKKMKQLVTRIGKFLTRERWHVSDK